MLFNQGFVLGCMFTMAFATGIIHVRKQQTGYARLFAFLAGMTLGVVIVKW